MSLFLKPPALAIGSRDIDTLARTVLGEAEGEALLGKIAVAWVVVNRALQRKQTLTAVCLAPLQFSCWNDGSPRRARMEEATFSDPYFRSCFGVALLVLAGEYADPTYGAVNYFTKVAPPGAHAWPPTWALELVETAKFGAHVFYRERND